MEVRKVQTTSAGTYIVTIPKGWAAALGLEKGGPVNMELEEGEIVLSAVNARPVQQSRPLQMEKVADRKMMELSISASYIQGHDITEVISKSQILPEQKRWIREAVENLVGVEISEEYSDKVVLQNLVDPFKFDLNKSMERFSATSIAVLSDAVGALATNDKVLAQDAYERGFQSTRLYRLLMRLAIQAIRNRKLRDEMKIYDLNGIVVRMMAIKELGRIAYYSMRVAQHTVEVEKRPEGATVQLVEKMTRTTTEMQERAFNAFVGRDLELASSVIDGMDEVRRLYETVYLAIYKGGQPSNVFPLGLIIRDIRGVAGYAVALADDAVLAVFG